MIFYALHVVLAKTMDLRNWPWLDENSFQVFYIIHVVLVRPGSKITKSIQQ